MTSVSILYREAGEIKKGLIGTAPCAGTRSSVQGLCRKISASGALCTLELCSISEYEQ